MTFDRYEYMRRKLQGEVDAAKRLRDQYITKFASDSTAIGAIRWMQEDPRTIISAILAQEILDRFAHPDCAADPRAEAERLIASLKHRCWNWSPEYSTNPFSNYVHAEELVAMKNVIEILRGYVHE